MIDATGNAQLVDFDLSRCQGEGGARQSMHTVSLYLPYLLDQPLMAISQGTWQFVSTEQLLNPGKAYVVSDELESLFFVTLYEGIHWVIHNKPAKMSVGNIFDSVVHHSDGSQTGGTGKMPMYLAPNHANVILEQLSFTESPPFTKLIRELFILFQSLAHVNAMNEAKKHIENAKKLETCEEVIRLMENAVNGGGWLVVRDKAPEDNYPRDRGIDEEDTVGRASLKEAVAGPSKRGLEEGDDNVTKTKRPKGG